jgi:Leucine-rich repeat (LRR) protein
MRISMIRILHALIPLVFIFLSSVHVFAQEEEVEIDEIAQYEEEVRQMVSFLQYSMNVLGDPSFSAKEKDVVINDSFSKIFADEKVQIEDDLDANRDVVTNKDVQAYLKDVDFFFRQVTFDFNIIEIDHSENHEGNLFFTVELMRSLKGITVSDDSMNNDLERYIEINLDEENKDLKIASIYTTKLSMDQELNYWWTGLSKEWRTILGVDIKIREGLRLNEVEEFSDSTYIVDGQEVIDSVKIIDYVKQAASKTEIDLAGSYLIQNLKPLDRLKNLKRLNLSGSSIKDIFPIRNITTLEFLDCSNTIIEDLSPLRYSKSLKELIISNTPVSSIVVIENFEQLEVLNLTQTVIDSLPLMTGLVNLKELYCGSTNLQKLDSIRQLRSLEILDCSNTVIEDLEPIAQLSHLRNLNLSQTNITNLDPLKALKSLEEINIEATDIDDVSALAGLENLKIIHADNTKIETDDFIQFSDQNESAELIFMSDALQYFWEGLEDNWKRFFKENLAFNDSISGQDLHDILGIQQIDISNREGFVELSPLKYTLLLEELDFSGTLISDLGPAIGLKKLTKINGSGSQVVHIAGLGEIKSLKVINFQNTGVSSISGISGLGNVDSLIFNRTLVKDISALNELGSFKLAYFDSSRVTDEDVLKIDYDESESILVYKSEKLRSWWGNMEDKWQDIFSNEMQLTNRPSSEQLHQLAARKSIEVSETSLRSLQLIPEFIRLESLIFSKTRINSLYPLVGLTKLKILECPRNPISEIDPLASLKTLEVLDLNQTQVSKLDPLSALPNLKELTFSGTNVKDLSPLSDIQSLEILDFSKTRVKQIRDLDNLENLKTLNCYNNKISERRIEDFRMDHPDCEVIFY